MRVRYLGGPTAILEIGGVRLLTDPTFDLPGEYRIGERVLTKTQGPALGPGELGPVDAVLLSHDQHADNLDRAGREYVQSAWVMLSTAAARERLGEPVRVLSNWEEAELQGAGGGALRVTGVPARHGPEGSEPLVGEVTGFVLSGPGLPTVYVSGDNASLDLMRVIAARVGSFDVALLSAGAAETRAPRGGVPYAHERARGGGRPDPRLSADRTDPLRRLGALHPGRRRAAGRLRASGTRRASPPLLEPATASISRVSRRRRRACGDDLVVLRAEVAFDQVPLVLELEDAAS
jgi:L-ascorbate metabolism protein UlaG (beta-lactamase superfamily)